jgi:hypothetical protein
MKMILISILLLFALSSHSIEVALIKVFDRYGKLVQLEKGGEFTHSAIKVQGGWMHAHPYRGVEIVSSIQEMGFKKTETKIFYNNNIPEVSNKFIDQFLGLPYDSNFSWSNDKIYCSELVAKALGIEPTPMSFDEELWGRGMEHRRVELGLSPDDLVEPLLNIGFEKTSCSGLFLGRIPL